MDKELEQFPGTPDSQAEGSSPGTEAPVSSASRRKFTRGAVIGGAVVFSLGNRAAWSVPGNDQGGGNDPVCLSAATVASMAAYNNGQRASMSPTTADAIDKYNLEMQKGGRTVVEGPDGSSCVVKEQ